jgi:catechol 2,3-dioxygenase-like lactoylglutathione lyase family enzyme
MISHVYVGITDFAPAFQLYSAVMGALGMRLRFADPAKPWAAWMPAETVRPLFLIGAPYDGSPATPGNGQMIALSAPSRAAVDLAYAAAMANGAADEGAPGVRPQYHPNYYGAYFRDMDGNKLCVVCHEAPPP